MKITGDGKLEITDEAEAIAHSNWARQPHTVAVRELLESVMELGKIHMLDIAISQELETIRMCAAKLKERQLMISLLSEVSAKQPKES